MRAAGEALDETDATANLLAEDAVLVNRDVVECPLSAADSSGLSSSSAEHARRRACGYKAVILSGSMVAAVVALCRWSSTGGGRAAQLSTSELVSRQEKFATSAKDWQQANLMQQTFLQVLETTAAPTPAPPAPWPKPVAGVGIVDPDKPPTLFCFSMVLVDGVEKWLVSTQWEKGTGIFGCHRHELLSDGNLTLTSYTKAPKHAVALPGEKAWFAPAKLTPQGIWHNTNVFLRAWRYIAKQEDYLDYDWTVKADPDCVFMPGKLQSILHTKQYDVTKPIVLLNCAQWGSIQGPLEVSSKAGSKKFFEGLDNCLDWTQWKEWGEDWFVNRCMNILSVQGEEGYETLDDMWCKVDYSGTGHNYEEEVKMNGPACNDGKAAFHPYKTTEDMNKCLDQAMAMHPR